MPRLIDSQPNSTTLSDAAWDVSHRRKAPLGGQAGDQQSIPRLAAPGNKPVVEVSYDYVTGGRFRHGTRLLRWRSDMAPKLYTMEQID